MINDTGKFKLNIALQTVSGPKRPNLITAGALLKMMWMIDMIMTTIGDFAMLPVDESTPMTQICSWRSN